MNNNTSYTDFQAALEAALRGAPPARGWLVPLLSCNEQDAVELFREADRVRRENVGDDIHLRALLEFSNFCRKDCRYCGLRRDNKKVKRYRLSAEDIIKTALEAEKLGYRTMVMQSGEDAAFTRDVMANIIKGIKEKTDLAVTLSLGERDIETYRAWREAGADRYLLRIETTNPELFKSVHPDDDLDKRMKALMDLKELGYQLGTGVLLGLPGQTLENLADDIAWMHGIGAEMLGNGPLIPHPDTPLGREKGGEMNLTLRFVSVLRLVFPHAHIPATTAMGTLHPQGRESALRCGANVIMPNIGPMGFRKLYEIYPGKIYRRDDAKKDREAIVEMVESLGRTVGKDHGHVWRPVQEKK